MDFLDPKRKKAHGRRLFIGYVLMAIAISMGTIILLFTAYGFDVDRKTGEIIQNGTVFLESQPSNASVLVNGERQSNGTGTRLALPGSKQYTISLEKDGYHTWSRSLALDGGSIERLVYPLLVPKKIKTSELQLYAAAPGLVSQSKDRKKLLVQQPAQTYIYDLYDLDNPTASPKSLTIPAAVLTTPAKASTIGVVEWSSDDKHVLLVRNYEGKQEYLLVDTEDVSKTRNINSIFSVSPSQVQLVDEKVDDLYIYEANSGIIRKASMSSGSLSAPIVSNALAFDSLGKDMIIYITREGAPEGSVSFRLREDTRASYLLKNVLQADSYLIQAEEYDNTAYFVVGSDKSDAAFVFRDPMPALKGQQANSLIVRAVMRGQRPKNAQFSLNRAFISVQTDKGMIVYDIEEDRQFTFTSSAVTSTNFQWMDGYRFIYTLNNELYMVDFDGSNLHKLASVNAGTSGYFAPNHERLFTTSPSLSVSGRTTLLQSDLIIR